jgi:hypothetical protein
MRDGNEYGSIVSCTSSSSDLVPELRRAIRRLASPLVNSGAQLGELRLLPALLDLKRCGTGS